MFVKPENITDIYKTGHGSQMPRNTTFVYSNLTPRSDRLSNIPKHLHDSKVVLFGLQAFIKSFLIEKWNLNFFSKPREEVVARYQRRMNNALGPGKVSAESMGVLHDLGYLPIEIRALKEGTAVNVRVPMLVIFNTHDDFAWLTNYIETVLSDELWLPCTSATTARAYRRLLQSFADKTGTHTDFVKWQGHDFSMRGMANYYAAASSGAGHLLYFTGTDTIPAIDLLEEYYGADSDVEMIGGSVPATEHSVMCMGEKTGEVETFRYLMANYPDGILSVVSDTWDFWNVITNTARTLKDEIMGREGKLVFRPDSGNPVDILCGSVQIHDYSECVNYATALTWATEEARDIVFSDTPHGECGVDTHTIYFRHDGKLYEHVTSFFWNRHDKQYYYIDEANTQSCVEVELTPAQKGAVECLWEIFGGTVNEAGYKVLDSHVGLIYGDSITPERAESILTLLEQKGFASGNVVFGIGSYTYQYVTRDTWGFAVKATYGVVDGVGRALFKDPVAASATKKSAKGLLKVVKTPEGYALEDEQPNIDNWGDQLIPVFRDGKLLVEYTLQQIRELAESEL